MLKPSEYAVIERRGSAGKAACFLIMALSLWSAPGGWGAELKPQTLEAWNTYVRLTEQRIAGELNDGPRFLVADFLGDGESRSIRTLLRKGEVPIRKMKTSDGNGREIEVKDGMIHHWLGGIFVPDTKLDALLRWLQDYDRHEQYFKEVEKSKLLSRQDPTYQIFFRLRRKKVVTVVYNTNHTAVYRYHDARRVSSRSFTTRIAEVDNAGALSEKEKPVGDDSGFLWRLNSYWRFQEDDGGVIVECESLSLSRAIPNGLGWLISRYVESVPRESLENTLNSVRDGSRKAGGSPKSDR